MFCSGLIFLFHMLNTNVSFHSLSLQTRQLNIWGFVRTETIGGVRGGWQHENFLSGRPDLLKGIERTEVKSKSASKKSSSTTKAQTSSRSVRRAAKSAEKVVIVADESSCSSAQVGSQASLSSYKDKSASSIAPPVSQAFQGPVFHYFDHIPVSSVNCEQSNVQDSVSLSSSSVSDLLLNLPTHNRLRKCTAMSSHSTVMI